MPRQCIRLKCSLVSLNRAFDTSDYLGKDKVLYSTKRLEPKLSILGYKIYGDLDMILQVLNPYHCYLGCEVRSSGYEYGSREDHG